MWNDAFSGLANWLTLLHRFIGDPFLGGFCGHLVLPVTLLLVLVFVSPLLRFLGVPYLFWHERPWKQFCVGIGLFWLYSVVVFVGYVLETRPQATVVSSTHAEIRPSFMERLHLPPQLEPLSVYFLGTTLSIAYILFLLAFALAFLGIFTVFLAGVSALVARASEKAQWPLILGAALSFVLLGVVGWLLLTQAWFRPLVILFGIPLIVLVLELLAAKPEDHLTVILGVVVFLALVAGAAWSLPNPSQGSGRVLLPLLLLAVGLSLLFRLVWPTTPRRIPIVGQWPEPLASSGPDSQRAADQRPGQTEGDGATKRNHLKRFLWPRGTPRLVSMISALLCLEAAWWYYPSDTTWTWKQGLFVTCTGVVIWASGSFVERWRQRFWLDRHLGDPNHPLPYRWPLFAGLGFSFLLLAGCWLLVMAHPGIRLHLGETADQWIGLLAPTSPRDPPEKLFPVGMIIWSFFLSLMLYLYPLLWVFGPFRRYFLGVRAHARSRGPWERVWNLISGLFSPGLAFLSFLSVLLAVYGILAFRQPFWDVLTVGLTFGVVLLLIISNHSSSKRRHQIPGLDYPVKNSGPPPADPPPREASSFLLDVVKVKESWWQESWRGERRPVAVVCVSGGGLRAAAWTLAVLREIELKLHPIPFPYHVLLFTGASGGMVGAASYVAALQRPGSPKVRSTADLLKGIQEDCLTPVVYQMLYGDLLTAFLPFYFPGNRGEVLEETWGDHLGFLLDQTFENLRTNEQEGWCPHLVFSPMLVETGQQLLISNLNLDRLTNNGDSAAAARFQLFRQYPEAHGRFKLSTAARLSASFPFVSPTAVLPMQQRRRVVDAGYYDNYGVSLASAWLFAYGKWLAKQTAGVALLQIRDDKAKDLSQGAGGSLFQGLELVTNPLQGVLTAWNASMTFRNNEHLELVNLAFRRTTGKDDFFRTWSFELEPDQGEKVSLSWYLTEDEQRRIKNGTRNESVRQNLDALKGWWQERSRPACSP